MAFPIVPIVLALLPKLLEYGGRFARTGIDVTVAAITAIPPTIMAIATFIKYVGESALLSFFLAAVMFGIAGLYTGWSWDAPIRERIKDRANIQIAEAKKAAISDANKRADIAIAGYAKQVEDLKRQIKPKR